MKKSLIDRFFRELDREWARPAEIILTGAAAGALYGHIRPSLDIDFEIRAKGRKARARDAALDETIRKVSQKLGIAVDYSEDIGHWSMISHLDYRKAKLPYKKIGLLDIKLMAPEYWTIGKMGRYYEIDTNDLVKVIRKRKIKPETLIRLWGRALARSPLSLALRQFHDHVAHFLRRYGKSLWGKKFNPEKAIVLFRQTAKWQR